MDHRASPFTGHRPSPSGGDFTYPYAPDLIPGNAETSGGMWRWRKLLPLDGSGIYPLHVGGTPLLAPAQLRKQLGLPGLVLKDETRSPTGSNKDRATALCVTDALLKGAPAIACASTGNVAVSLSAGAAATCVPAYVFVSGGTVAPHKVDLMHCFGATVILVDGTYGDAYRLSEAACERLGWYSRNTGTNPLAVQGKKTVAFEVWEQLGQSMPSVAYLPVGDGVTLAAFVLGCEELVRCKVADRVPRVIGVQASGAAPLVRAYEEGRWDWTPVEGSSIADGIAVGDPFYGAQALDAVRRTGGELIAVGDDTILKAVAMLARSSGLLAEPAGAAALAGAMAHPPSARDGEEAVLVLVTGTGLKDQRWLPREGGRTVEAPADIEALLARVR